MAEITGMQFANTVLNDYYSNILKELPADTIERAVISTPEQTVESITEQVRGYLQPQYESAVRQRQEQTKQNKAAIDVDAASRGMQPSTWVSDSKTRQLNAEASDIADLGSDYTATLAENVATQYENYLNHKAGVDEVNAGNQIEVDKWNSQVKTALEELAYSRALGEFQRSPNGRGYVAPSGGDGGYGSSGGSSGASGGWTITSKDANGNYVTVNTNSRSDMYQAVANRLGGTTTKGYTSGNSYTSGSTTVNGKTASKNKYD